MELANSHLRVSSIRFSYPTVITPMKNVTLQLIQVKKKFNLLPSFRGIVYAVDSALIRLETVFPGFNTEIQFSYKLLYRFDLHFSK